MKSNTHVCKHLLSKGNAGLYRTFLDNFHGSITNEIEIASESVRVSYAVWRSNDFISAAESRCRSCRLSR